MIHEQLSMNEWFIKRQIAALHVEELCNICVHFCYDRKIGSLQTRNWRIIQYKEEADNYVVVAET